jgi:non-homologous end joining protein Ku
MLEAKLKGEQIVVPEAPHEAPVVDLMEALRQSLAAVTHGSSEERDRPKRTRRRAASA